MSASASLQHRRSFDFASTSRTHVGRARQVNEDRVLDRSDRALWAVADGMGGHRGGDIAADIAIAALRALADDPAPITPPAIESALVRANTLIHDRAASAGAVIGSTIVALHVEDEVAHLCWVGDSRAYRVERDRWMQVTHDHSLVQELVDRGLINQAQAMQHPRAHVITRALGVEGQVDIAWLSWSLTPGEIVLLCSDGLSRTLESQAPQAVDQRVADHILGGALDRDGSDNISFVLIAAN